MFGSLPRSTSMKSKYRFRHDSQTDPSTTSPLVALRRAHTRLLPYLAHSYLDDFACKPVSGEWKCL